MWRTLRYFLVFATAFSIFLNSIDGEFVYDDSEAVVHNEDVLGSSSVVDLLKHDFWGNPIAFSGSHKSWRPLTVLTFRLNRLVGGLNASGFRLVNVLLHAEVTCLVLRLTEELKFDKESALYSALLFASHPIHCDAVDNAVGRAELLGAIFLLIAIINFNRTHDFRVLTLMSALALMSKETAALLPATVGMQQVVFGKWKRKKLLHLLSKLSVLQIGIVAFRMWIMGTPPHFSKADNPFAHEEDFFTRSASLMYLPVFNFWLLLVPNQLSFDWSMDSVPAISSPFDCRFLLVVGFYGLAVLLIGMLVKRKYRVVTSKSSDFSENSQLLYLVGFALISFLPSSNLFFYVGFVVAERVLYIPSIAFCIIIGSSLRKFTKKYPLVWHAPFLALLAIYSHRSYNRNFDWKSSESLYFSAIDINPPKAYANLGQIYASTGRPEMALRAYKEALKYRPNMADTWYNLASLQLESGNNSVAIKSLMAALEIRPNFAQALLNLGVAHWRQGTLSKAQEAFWRCSKIDGRSRKNGRSHQHAVVNCLYNLGKMERDWEKAALYYRDALNRASASHPLIENIREAVKETAKLGEQLKMGNQRKSNSTSITDLLAEGKAYKQKGDYRKAVSVLQEALSRDRTSLEVLHLLADSLLQLGRNEECEGLFEEAARRFPSVETFSNYGAILHVNKKHAKAVKFYEKALDQRPGDQIVLENLEKARRILARKMVKEDF